MEPSILARQSSRRGRIFKLNLDAASSTPLTHQIIDQLREAIRAGRLQPGRSLPSTRALAADLGVSRSTVVTAIDELRAQGYLMSRQGARTRVHLTPPMAPDRLAEAPPRPAAEPMRMSRRAHAVAAHVGALSSLFVTKGPRPFRLGVPASDVFPTEAWASALGSAWRRTSPNGLGYSDPRGHAVLRQLVAEHVSASRGVRCTAEQVIICAGSQQAVGLAALALLDPGEPVLMEDPGYFGAHAAFTLHGQRVVSLPTDAEGGCIAAAETACPEARVAYIMPTRNVMLGSTTSRARRNELLSWILKGDRFLIEDDYGAEFHFSGKPPGALQGEDASGRVMYVGSFSKVMYPSLRLGFLVAPSEMIEQFSALRFSMDLQPPHLEQAAMAVFMEDGHYERHLRRLRQTCLAREATLTENIERELGGVLQVVRIDGGMNLTTWLPPQCDDRWVADEIQRDGVQVAALSRFTRVFPKPPALVLGFGGVRTADIKEGVQAMARTFERIGHRLRTAS